MWEIVRRVPATRVAHRVDVKRGASLVCWIDWRRGELDARKACLAGDEPHRSSVLEEVPPPINISVVLGHGVGALLGSPAAPPLATASADLTFSSSSSAAAAAVTPTASSHSFRPCGRIRCC